VFYKTKNSLSLAPKGVVFWIYIFQIMNISICLFYIVIALYKKKLVVNIIYVVKKVGKLKNIIFPHLFWNSMLIIYCGS
jgi:hypothetical protein